MNEPLNGRAEPIDDMNRHGRRVEELMREIEALPDTAPRALFQDCLASLLAFYGEGLQRTLQIIKRSGIGGQRAYDELIADRVVSGLLLIHGLHPVDLETRLRGALDKIRPYLQSHGGNVEFLSLVDGLAHLRLVGACKTCPSSSVTLELAVRHAIEEACPDLQGFEVEGAIPVEHQPHAAPEWSSVDGAQHLEDGAMIRTTVLGSTLLVCKAGGDLYAYRDRCPACNLPLHLGTLQAGILACRAGHRFSVRDAGLSADGGHLHLDPLPLVSNNGSVRVAVPREPEPEAVAQ